MTISIVQTGLNLATAVGLGAAIGRVNVSAHLTATERVDAVVERIVGRLSLEQTVSAARRQADNHVDTEEANSFNRKDH